MNDSIAAAPRLDGLSIRPSDSALGADVIGLDLSKPLPDGVLDTLRTEFIEHKVLCFRDQHFSEQDMMAFSRLWGSLGEHIRPGSTHKRHHDINVISNAGPDGLPNGRHTDESAKRWHTDRSFMVKPALATFLYAVAVPRVGADTLFADTAAAYDALPEAMKARIAGLKAVHSIEESRRRGGYDEATEDERRKAPPVLHPLVKVHPESGRRTLYCGAHAVKVVGLPEEESDALLDELVRHATEPRFVYAHKWRRGDLVMWDNRSTLHAASDFDGRELRTLWRTIVSDAPTELA